jgi:hypothetical protein
VGFVGKFSSQAVYYQSHQGFIWGLFQQFKELLDLLDVVIVFYLGWWLPIIGRLFGFG